MSAAEGSGSDGSGSDGATAEGASEGSTEGATTGTEGTATSAPARRRWGGREYSPEEIEAAKQQWRDMRPWDSPMARADKVLIGATVAVIVFGLASLPFRPFLLASHPVLLSLATGSLSAIGARRGVRPGGRHRALAGGRRGRHRNDQVRLVVLVGRQALGREGRPILRAQRAGAALRRARPVLAHMDHAPARGRGRACRGVPSLLVHLLAGLAGMRLLTFLLANAVGAALVAGLVAGLGYALGQYAVDVVLAVDRYALWITIAIAVFVAYRAGFDPEPEGQGAARGGSVVRRMIDPPPARVPPIAGRYDRDRPWPVVLVIAARSASAVDAVTLDR